VGTNAPINNVAIRICVGQRPLHNAKLFVIMAINLSRGKIFDLLALERVRQMEFLDFGDAGRFEAGAIEPLVSSPDFGGLKALNLEAAIDPSSNDLSGLMNSRTLENLTFLNLGFNDLGLSGAEVIAQSLGLPKLKHLFLNNNGLVDDGAVALSNIKSAGQLETLALGRNYIGNRGADAVTGSQFSSLVSLGLGRNYQITGEWADGFARLARARFRKLQKMSLLDASEFNLGERYLFQLFHEQGITLVRNIVPEPILYNQVLIDQNSFYPAKACPDSLFFNDFKLG
jgi:hypothetical protein